MTAIHQDWKEFLLALLSENTRFLLIGAHALAFHVEARLTEDLDVFVEPSPENAERLYRALDRFGFGGLIADASELTFDEAWASRVKTDFHGVELFVIGRDALLKNKRASGRRNDLVDVALLEEAAGEEPS